MMKNMSEILLQPVIFLGKWIREKKLYYGYDGTGTLCYDGNLIIAKDTVVDFATYFNSFSVCKWKEYTEIKNFKLRLKLIGKGSISINNYALDGGTVKKTELMTAEFDCPADWQSPYGDKRAVNRRTSDNSESEDEWISVSLPDVERGVIGFSLRSYEGEVQLLEGGYYADDPADDSLSVRNISLAIAFTTYKREDYIKRNIESILALNDDRINIYIADNAGTLETDEHPSLHIYDNINSGGAGGFSRNMLEIIKEKGRFTHVILMDDDVTIDPRVFDRLIRLLSLVKTEYADAFVGGAMFRRDHEYFHVESGAKRKGLTVYPYGYGLDMRRMDAVLHTDTFHKEDYNAWWLCCMPAKYIDEDNLPLPLFFQWDDIDYGIRNKAPLILMNGICVWHDAFDTKRTAMHTYYSNRNPLIVNCCHGEGASERRVLKELKKKVCTEICLYRYEHAEALIQAMEDFLRGPEWLCSLDPEEYNKKILALNRQVSYVADKVDFEWYLVGCGISDCDALHAIVRVLTMNGYLLKANREHTLPLYADRSVQGYRAKRLLFYEVNTGTGYYAEKDIKKAFLCMMRFHKLYFRMWFRYPSVAKKYRDSYAYMTSKKMWEKYLKLQGEYSG